MSFNWLLLLNEARICFHITKIECMINYKKCIQDRCISIRQDK
jgi:hypothetical protein